MIINCLIASKDLEFESRIKSAIDDLTNGHADTIYCYTDGGYDG